MKRNYIGVLVGLAAGLLSTAVFSSGNIDSSDKYAWSCETGWVNFGPTNGGATVHNDYLEGYVWCENIGWIRLGDGSGGPYNNDASDDWGVNVSSSGELSGYGWSPTSGWVNFNPTNGGVSVDADGQFSGYAWCENVGWIKMSNSGEPAYQTATAENTLNGASGTWGTASDWSSGVVPVYWQKTYVESGKTVDVDGGDAESGNLRLEGRVSLNGGTLTISELGEITDGDGNSGLSDFSDANMIITDNSGTTGTVRKLFADGSGVAGVNEVFPVGTLRDGSTYEYAPVGMTFSGAGTFTGNARLGVSAVYGKHANNDSTANYLNRYWTVEDDSISGAFSCDLTAQYPAANLVGAFASQDVWKWDGAWSHPVTNSVSATQLTATVDSFSDITTDSIEFHGQIEDPAREGMRTVEWSLSPAATVASFHVQGLSESGDWLDLRAMLPDGERQSVRIDKSCRAYRVKVLKPNGACEVYPLRHLQPKIDK